MQALSVFAKYWEPGQVKTRLAQTVSDVTAARLHEAFLRTTLSRLEDLADLRSIVYAPFDKGHEFEPLAAKRWRLEPQVQGSLGRRMEAHVENFCPGKAEKVVLLGADCPHAGLDAIRDAFEELDRHDAVVGPTEDGGYWILGLKRSLPIFSGIPWGTAGVMSATVHRLESHGLTYQTLPTNFDIDNLDDLTRLRAEIRTNHQSDSHLQTLGRQMTRILDGG